MLALVILYSTNSPAQNDTYFFTVCKSESLLHKIEVEGDSVENKELRFYEWSINENEYFLLHKHNYNLTSVSTDMQRGFSFHYHSELPESEIYFTYYDKLGEMSFISFMASDIEISAYAVIREIIE